MVECTNLMRFGQIENNKDEIALKSPLSVKETFQFNKPSMSIWSRSVNLKTSQHSLPCFLTRSAKRTFGPGLSIYFFCSLLDVIFQLLFLLLAVCALSNTSFYDSFYHPEILSFIIIIFPPRAFIVHLRVCSASKVITRLSFVLQNGLCCRMKCKRLSYYFISRIRSEITVAIWKFVDTMTYVYYSKYSFGVWWLKV